MILVVDVGNTNTVLAVFDKGVVVGQWRMSTFANRTRDEYALWFTHFLAQKNIQCAAIKHSVLASVVPQTHFAITHVLKDLFGEAPLVVTGETIRKAGMTLEVDHPEEVGADRVINALAAYERTKGETIVIDFGTATTFDVVSAKGAYCGGVIAPGINLSLEALQRAAAKLPNVAVGKPTRATGRNTVEAMQSGIYYGYLGLIERIVKEIRAETGMKGQVLATGGLAPLFAAATSTIDALVPDLTIEGLYLFAQRCKDAAWL
jgi:type III pantothenate kinase